MGGTGGKDELKEIGQFKPQLQNMTKKNSKRDYEDSLVVLLLLSSRLEAPQKSKFNN
jgi:hypothetical protein